MNARSRIHTIRPAATRSRADRAVRRRSLTAGPAGLCLLLALASVATVAAAREVKLAANSASCQEAHHDQPASSPVPAAAPAGSGGTAVDPSLHSDTLRGGRLQSPRWHSFLPGMFR